MHHLKRTARWLAACLGLLLLLSPMLPASSIHTGRSDSDFKVVAYYPSWRPDSQRSKLQYDIVTHINYAFAIPTQDGGLKPLENASGAKKLIEEAHANGVKVLLAVGGWNDQDVLLEPVFASATATTAKRSRLVNEIVAMCDQYGFDGVDIDWEYPRTSGTYRQYEQLLSALSQRLHAQGKLLTTAVIGGVTVQGKPYSGAMAFTDAALEQVDWINVMAYDRNETDHSPYDFATDCADYWLETRGLPAEKIVLGVPFYARPGSVTYSAILSADSSAGSKDSIWYKGKQIWYNGIDTIQAKTSYALEKLGGVMIWEITQDTADRDKSLLSAIGAAIREGGVFPDVPKNSWFAGEVEAAYQLGLMKGTGQGMFTPYGTVTWGEAVLLTARIHLIHHTGSDSLTQGTPWYQAHADYAWKQGILTEPLTARQAVQPITRAEFAGLLAAALPAEELAAINTVGSIPGLSPNSPHRDAVYQLYRAGVLTGGDASGSFFPQRTLTRAEAAALSARMLDADRRQRFTLP